MLFRYIIEEHAKDRKVKIEARKNFVINCVTAAEVYFKDVVKALPEFPKIKENEEGLKDLLKEDGYLVVMTSFRTMDVTDFLSWWYRRDTTHISFYHVKTFEEIVHRVGLKIVKHNQKNVIILKRA